MEISGVAVISRNLQLRSRTKCRFCAGAKISLHSVNVRIG